MQRLREYGERRAKNYAEKFQAQAASSGGVGGQGGGGSGGSGGGQGGGGGLSQAEVKYLAEKVSYLDKSVNKLNKLGDSVESRMGASISSAGFGRTAKKFQAAVRKATMGVVQAWSQLYLFIIVLLLLFILHQATLTLTTPHIHIHKITYRLQICAVIYLDRRGPRHRL